jgi:nucleoside-diphosphate-sugar epimerase
MKIGIFGANSQIAKDLITAFLQHDGYELILFSRNPKKITNWLSTIGNRNHATASSYEQFINSKNFDWIINFVGVGDPAMAVNMGKSIFQITSEYDNLAIKYLIQNSKCRYIFLSSGAVYGSNFEEPVDFESKASCPVNNIQPHDWYAAAKLHAEWRHRSLEGLGIVDLRIFNYFSCTQNLSARFLITDILRAIKEKYIFKTSSENIVPLRFLSTN